jgi:uncharacterized protein YvpB
MTIPIEYGEEGRVIMHSTYLKFAKKYRIPLKTITGKVKTFKRLARDIYRYEMVNVLPKPEKYGLYVLKNGKNPTIE